MHSSSTAPARRTPTDAKSSFVSFPARSPARDLAVKSALLLALKALGHAPPHDPPLVAVSVTSPSDLGLASTLVKQVGKRVIQLDMGNHLESIQQALFGTNARCLDQQVLKKSKLYLDEAYLHDALKPWEKGNSVDGFLLAATGLHGSRTLAFTVRFGDRRSRLGADPGRLLRCLRNEITAIARLGPLMMVVEFDAAGRPHLHGIVQTSEPMHLVKGLLWRMGGKSSNYRFRNGFQVRLDESPSCMGWCHYMLKDLVSLPRSDAERHIYLSNSAKRVARQARDELSWVSRRRLLVTPERRGRARVYRTNATGGARAATLGLAA